MAAAVKNIGLAANTDEREGDPGSDDLEGDCDDREGDELLHGGESEAEDDEQNGDYEPLLGWSEAHSQNIWPDAVADYGGTAQRRGRSK